MNAPYRDPIPTLVDRLNTGWTMCEREIELAKRARLEAPWIALLCQYETTCDATEMIVDAEAA
jgi:hypothetical protein